MKSKRENQILKAKKNLKIKEFEGCKNHKNKITPENEEKTKKNESTKGFFECKENIELYENYFKEQSKIYEEHVEEFFKSVKKELLIKNCKDPYILREFDNLIDQKKQDQVCEKEKEKVLGKFKKGIEIEREAILIRFMINCMEKEKRVLIVY